MEKEAINFLFAGVGGQGTLLASDILAEVGLKAGYDVKKSEVHGMSQRGGAVVSHVRWGPRVASPLCEAGTVDYFIAQEMLEALRWLHYLRRGASVILSRCKLPPTATVFGAAQYPSEEEVLSAMGSLAGRILLVEAEQVAQELGNRRVANSVLLGALSTHLPPAPPLWLEIIEARVPAQHREINRQAFQIGRERAWESSRPVSSSLPSSGGK